MRPATFSIPPEERYFEDYVPGMAYEFGSLRVDRDEMLEFARRYDPQAFHTDEEAARGTIFGGLIASGWYTGVMMMQLYYRYYLPRAASAGSPGVNDISWPRPVRPGDVLSLRVTVLDARRSRSKPHLGIVTSLTEMLNQERQVVMSMKVTNFFLLREQ